MGGRRHNLANLLGSGALGRIGTTDSPTPAVPASESPRDGDAATRRVPEMPTAGDAAPESPRVAEVETPAVPASPTPPVAESPPPRLREAPRRPLAEVESARVPEVATHRRPQSPSPALTETATRQGGDSPTPAVADVESLRHPDVETPAPTDSPTPGLPKWKRLIRKDVHFDAATLDVLHRETRRIQHARAGIGGERVTESTLVRVMVRAMLDRLPEIQGADEETLLQSLRDAVSRSSRGG